MRQADVDDGIRDGLTTSEQNELVQLRRDKRRLEMENEILRRAAAYFAKDALPLPSSSRREVVSVASARARGMTEFSCLR